jgi:hypothetical protein
MIRVDGDPSIVNLDIIIRHGCSVFKPGISIGGDLHGLVSKVSELGLETASKKQECR